MFFRSSDIMITSTCVVRHADNVRFDLTEIEAPYIVRHGRGAGFRVGREIRARYRSADVRLFYTTNAPTFSAVRRALIRALEQRGNPLPI
ncbi:hypothetical protein [Dactylosporangium sp. CA-092794]|uniref:hypothetical protein n=1 Tax=Dactylosporangium sp. CA-092794 TaxID=3239929 RepID=UPI003D8F6774